MCASWQSVLSRLQRPRFENLPATLACVAPPAGLHLLDSEGANGPGTHPNVLPQEARPPQISLTGAFLPPRVSDISKESAEGK